MSNVTVEQRGSQWYVARNGRPIQGAAYRREADARRALRFYRSGATGQPPGQAKVRRARSAG